jgi:c-di-GMP-related signal transduction protein
MKKTIKKILSLSYNVLRYVMSVGRAKKKNITSQKIQINQYPHIIQLILEVAPFVSKGKHQMKRIEPRLKEY